MLRWSTGSFVPSKASICGILNFVGRGKCRTLAMNEDSICCTRASIDTGVRPFTASFIWPSSCWISLKRCSQDCALLSGWWGTGLWPSSFLLYASSSWPSPAGFQWSCSLVWLFSPPPPTSRGAPRCCCSSHGVVLWPSRACCASYGPCPCLVSSANSLSRC